MRHTVGHGFCLRLITGIFNHDADEFGRAFAIAHDELREFLCHFGECLSKLRVFRLIRRNMHFARTTGHDDERVIGRGVAINRNAVERLIGHLTHERIQVFLSNAHISRNKSKHGRHIGFNHASTFGNACESDGLPFNLYLTADRFG